MSAITRAGKAAPLTSTDHDHNIRMSAGWPTVAAMLASRETGFPAGSVLVAGGFRYQVVTSNPHMTTTGGVGLRVLPNDNGRANVAAFGALGNDSSGSAGANTAALQAACASGLDLDWPTGSFWINGTLSAQGNWYGAGAGGSITNNPYYSNTFSGQGTYIKCSGTNGGNPFLIPPRIFQGFHVSGPGTSGSSVGIRLGLPSSNTYRAFFRWSDVTVRTFGRGIDVYNMYNVHWDNINVGYCNEGVRCHPTAGSSDGGYVNAWNWINCHIGDCPTYGVSIDSIQLSKTINWYQCVIERCAEGASGTAQIHLRNVSLFGSGVYLEGTYNKPCLRWLGAAHIVGADWYVNAGNIDMNNQGDATFSIDRLNMDGNSRPQIVNMSGSAWVSLKHSLIRNNVAQSARVIQSSFVQGVGTIDFQVPSMRLGAGSNIRRHASGTAAPTSGTWARGDIVWNVNPSAGGTMGWMCVAAGTPGTWRPMPNLA
jgi:hypothetical protein